jgi:hypothetical protein
VWLAVNRRCAPPVRRGCATYGFSDPARSIALFDLMSIALRKPMALQQFLAWKERQEPR